MRPALLIVFCLLFVGNATAQTKIQLTGDLPGAPVIEVNKQYSFPKSPSGFGKLKEFKLNPARSTHIFREERNSSWFLIEVPYNGVLTFDLQPHHLMNDYDWMLFKYSSELNKHLQNESQSPIRSNNARNDISIASKTGMGKNASASFVKPGPGNNFSLPLTVKTGEKLALVIDNIYGGKGFDILITLKPGIGEPFVLLEGSVKDRHSLNNLSAEVTIEDDSTGVLIGTSLADPQTGRYRAKVPVNRPLNITAWNPAYIFATADTFLKQDSELNFLLDTPVSGNKLVLNNIHFFPNKDEILPSSRPELDRLLLFLKERPAWTVKITGHTNPNVFASARYLQQLSFNRAVAVKKFLTENEISDRRISCTGVGGKTPLVITRDPVEGLRNLRVEVTLVQRQ